MVDGWGVVSIAISCPIHGKLPTWSCDVRHINRDPGPEVTAFIVTSDSILKVTEADLWPVQGGLVCFLKSLEKWLWGKWINWKANTSQQLVSRCLWAYGPCTLEWSCSVASSRLMQMYRAPFHVYISFPQWRQCRFLFLGSLWINTTVFTRVLD